MVSETIRLLQVWEPGTTASQLSERVRSEGIFAKASAQRVSDIVNRMFVPRYLDHHGKPAIWSRMLVERKIASDPLFQILLLYTAREHAILYDFIAEVYWPRYSSCSQFLFRDDSVNFIKSAQATGRIPTRWTEGNNVRIGRYILSALYDFKMLGAPQGDRRPILPFNLARSTSVYLAHELHFAGLSDSQILTHTDWLLFGLISRDVLEELRKVSGQGRFIVQSGDFVRIAWSNQSMEECLDAVAS